MDERLSQVFALIDAANRQDPNQEWDNDQAHPKAWLYSQRMTQTLADFAPDASEALQIAARAQHIERWRIPRDDYPRNRPGYLKWRRELGQFHARRSAELMRQVGYDDATIAQVESLLTKQNLKQNPATQALEDVICLVFLQHYLADFAREHSEEKLIRILQKTWQKMSPAGQAAAQQVALPPSVAPLVNKALA